jgi:hypothetical protein
VDSVPTAQPVALTVTTAAPKPKHRTVHKHKRVTHTTAAAVTQTTAPAAPTYTAPAPVQTVSAPPPAANPAPAPQTSPTPAANPAPTSAPVHKHKKSNTGSSAGGTPVTSQGY